MTVLAELLGGRVSIECDLCIPPMLTVNTPDQLRRAGWELTTDGHSLDACHLCVPRTSARVRRADAVPCEPDPKLMPNLIVVGAMKAGTTSMHTYLGRHPQICPSRDKEPRFFSDPDCRAWVGTYQSQWPEPARYRLEATPRYSKWPVNPGVVGRMADLVPDAKLLYLVRDPIDRIVAEYVEVLQWRATNLSIAEELADAADPRNWLVASSRYATQLRAFRERYDADAIKVIDLAELAARPQDVFDDVLTFLGLEPLDLGSAVHARHNSREEKAAFHSWLLAIRTPTVVRAYRRIPEQRRQTLSRLLWKFRTAVETPELDPATRARLRDILQPEVDELRELSGLPLASWDW